MAVYSGVSFSPTETAMPREIAFNVDGTALYMFSTTGIIDQYALATPWDIATIVFIRSTDLTGVPPFSPAYQGTIIVDPTGTMIYLNDVSRVLIFTLSTPWDISSISYTSSLTLEASGVNYYNDMAISATGNYIYFLSWGTQIVTYYIPTPWDLSTAYFQTSDTLVIPGGYGGASSLYLNPAGDKLYVLLTTEELVLQYAMSTTWDITSAVYENKSFSVVPETTTSKILRFSALGATLYIGDSTTLYQYIVPTAWDITSTLKGIKITGFKKNLPTYLSYKGNTVQLLPSDSSNELAIKLRTLYLADPILAPDVGALSVTTAASAILHYSFSVTFSISSTIPVASSVETQDGTSVFTEDSHVVQSAPLEAMEGICAGRSRLIAWDSEGRIYNSATPNLVDFIPSAATGANQVSVPAIKGKIIVCKPFTQGFVIYATGNAVVATFKKSATSLYDYLPVDNSEGLVDYRHIATHQELHYYWSSKGLIVLDPAQHEAKDLAKELTDWLKKYRYPISISMLSNRFLIIYLQDRDKVFSNRAVRLGGNEVTAKPAHASLSPVEFSMQVPGVSLYPVYQRALVFDTQLAKWGTCDLTHTMLVSLTPINQSGYNLSKNYQLLSAVLDNEQRELAIKLGDGYTRLCTTYPTNSYVLFGHYAAHRNNLTKLVSITTEYVDYPDSTLQIESSHDGAKVDFDNLSSYAQTKLVTTQDVGLAAKWFNILIKGHYNIKRMLVRGYKYGRSE